MSATPHSLRARPPAQVPLLAAACLAGLVSVLAPGLAEQLRAYSWPGNIRELDHALKHAAAMVESEVITVEDLPPVVQASCRGGKKAADPPPSDQAREGSGPAPLPGAAEDVINVEVLRRQIRTTSPARSSSEAAHEIPAHIEYAKRTWLATLIDECGGDLALIARYWDRSSEKTLRNLIRSYGLTEQLAAARSRGRTS